MKRSLALLAPLALAIPLAACGGDDGDGGSAADWCSYAADIRDGGDEFESLSFTDPAALEDSLNDLRALFDDAADVAPAEIRADVETSRDAFGMFEEALEDADFDMFQLDPTVLESFGSDFEPATERIAEYNRTECGFEDDEVAAVPEPVDDVLDEASDDTLPDDVSGAIDELEELQELMGDEGLEEILADDSIAGLFVEQLVTEFENQGFTSDEARCMAEAYDLEEILTGNFDPMDESGTFAIFEQCGISTERLVEIGG